MKDLLEIINKLNKTQVRLVRIYLKAFSSRNDSNPKILKVFNILLKENLTEKQILENIGISSNQSLKMMISRLKQKIFDVLILDLNVEKPSNFSDLGLNNIRIRKKLTTFSVIYNSFGSTKIVFSLLDEIIRLSKDYEDFFSLIQALSFRKNLLGMRLHSKRSKRLEKEINYYNQCAIASINANNIYSSLAARKTFEGTTHKEYLNLLEKSVRELSDYYKITPTSTILYFIKVIEYQLLYFQKKYLFARKKALERLELLNSENSVRRQERLGFVFGDLANCNIHLGNMKESHKMLDLGVSFFPYGSINFYVLKEIEFWSFLLQGQTGECLSLLFELKETINKNKIDFRTAKFKYFHATILFLKSKFKESYRIVNQKHVISRDKSGWELGIRVLAIMNLIEMGKFEEATKMVTNMQRHIQRWKKDMETYSRYFVIHKCLLEMMKYGFDPRQPGKKLPSLLTSLENQPKYKWEPFTPELIPFHTWAAKKYKLKFKKQKSAAK